MIFETDDKEFLELRNKLADKALALKAVRLSCDKPFLWASGYYMPIYNDNRSFLVDWEARTEIARAFEIICKELKFGFDNIAGTATAGIPHATTLADRMKKSLTYVRSKGKDHGLNQAIEGLGISKSYQGKSVLLIEDLISTGKSSIQAVEAIRNSEGACPYCLAIFSYGLEKSNEAFSELNPICEYHSILDYDYILKRAVETSYIKEKEFEILKNWRNAPFEWGYNNGFGSKK
ncbi:MAG: orotate phosphoribosyltransferase [Sphaerochaetaceae bacterium]|nr:orotate phosphoribosyltransferase [Sphaerochaetaceae bacterium]